MNNIDSVFVLGSTSEVSKEICIELAKKGCKRFHLVSRNLEKNKDLIIKLSEYNVYISEEKNDLLKNISLEGNFKPKIENFDLYLILSGNLGNDLKARNDSLEASKITIANYLGILPWLNSILTEERINKPGKLWIFSSVAGERGRPSNYHYGAAKAALTTYCEGVIARCNKKPFQIRLIKAGFIFTRLTKEKAPKFLCLSPKKIAKNLLRNPNKNGLEFLPWWWYCVMKIVRYSPLFIVEKL